MKSLLRIIFAAATASVLMASAVAPSDAASAHRTSTKGFDGLWSVTIMTIYGNCDRSYRYPLVVQNGRVLKADTDSSYQVAGAVAHNGAIRVTVSGGGQTASGYGRLAHNRGAGVWRTSAGDCSGRWSAERRG